ATQGDDGSGFAIDVGGYHVLKNKSRAALSIQNILSTISETDTLNAGRQAASLPRIFNLSFSYPLREWIDLYLGLKYYTTTDSVGGGSDRDTLLYLGVEYRFAGKGISVRNGFQQESLFTGEAADKYAPFGVSYVTESYNAAFGTMAYNNSSDTPLALSVSYKPEAWSKWKEPSEQEKDRTSPGELSDDIDKKLYEKPLPALGDESTERLADDSLKLKEQPDSESSTASSGRRKRGQSDAGAVSSTPSAPSAERTIIAKFEIDPKIILIPSASRQNFSNLDKHWVAGYVDELSESGFFPAKSGSGFVPGESVERREFYRLLFLSQISDLFSNPISVSFKTPYAVNAELWLVSPGLEKPALLQEGTYERAG
ncbi:MAG: hypothetical protein KAG97_11790, partial [Victivallales bacterium]|nr:hypothetical protein [Victivallales bacterium]